MKKKIKKICFDIDNTICKTKLNYYKLSKPIKKAIRTINALYDDGYIIIIYTARGMGSCNSNLKLVHKLHYNFTMKQLKKWGLKFHKLYLGKPSFDLFIDDKSLSFSKNWYSTLKKVLLK